MSPTVKNGRFGVIFRLILIAATALLALSWGAASGASSAAKGKSIPVLLLGTWSLPGGGGLPDVRDSMIAAIDAVNASGGVKGHPLSPVICDDQGNPNNDATCTEQAISDGVVVSLGAEPGTVSTAEPLLKNAGVANLGNALTDPLSMTSPVFFSTTGGPTAVFIGMPEAFAAQGLKKVSFIYPGDLGAASASILASVQQGVKQANLTLVETVGVPDATADFAPAVATALGGGSQGIMTYFNGLSQVTLLKAIRQANPSIPAEAGTFALLPSYLKALGSLGNGITVVGTGEQPTSNLAIAKQYRAEMKKYFPSKGVGETTDQGFADWIAVHQFQTIADKLNKVTRATVLAAFKHLNAYNSGGYLPPVNMTKTCTVCGAYPRMFAPLVTYLTIKNGVIVADKANQFHNIFTGAVVNGS